MKVAQHPGRRHRLRVGERLAPQRAELRARRSGQRDAAMRQIPVEQQLGFDQERLEVVRRKAMLDTRRDGKRAGDLLAVERDQHVDRRRIALLDRRRRIARDDALRCRDPPAAEALVEVGGVDFRRREAAVAQRRAPSRRTASRPRRDARSRCRACRRAPAARRAGAARSSGRACVHQARAAHRRASRHRPASADASRRQGRSSARKCRSAAIRSSRGAKRHARSVPRCAGWGRDAARA